MTHNKLLYNKDNVQSNGMYFVYLKKASSTYPV